MTRNRPSSNSRESGVEIVEWAVVTVILILATYAILLAVGNEVGAVANSILDAARRLIGG
ncbi:MAG: hypothetical protein ACYC5M_06795 [Anaerolineae bacterium]